MSLAILGLSQGHCLLSFNLILSHSNRVEAGKDLTAMLLISDKLRRQFLHKPKSSVPGPHHPPTVDQHRYHPQHYHPHYHHIQHYAWKRPLHGRLYDWSHCAHL